MDACTDSKCYNCIYYWRKYIPYGFRLNEPTHGKLTYYECLCFMS